MYDSKPSPPFHPIADVFPMMSDAEFKELVADIDAHGQLQPIFTYNKLVIDGRNRWRACYKLNLAPMTIAWEGEESELLDFVVSLNMKRRQLTVEQRAMVAAKIANLRKGDNQHTSIDVATSQKQAAKRMDVSVPSVQRAKTVLERGTPELVAAVEQGRVSVSAAATVVQEYADEPDILNEIIEKEEVKQEAKAIREKKKKVEIAAAAKEFFRSFDRKEASRQLGSIALTIAAVVDRHSEIREEFAEVFSAITELQQYIFPEHNQ